MEALKAAARLLMETPSRERRLLMKRALAWARLGSYRAALRDTTAGSHRSHPSRPPTPGIARTASCAAGPDPLQQGRPRDAIAIASEVVRDAEPLGPSRALAQAYDALDGAYFDLGQPGEGGPRDQGSRDLPRDRSGTGRSGDRVEPRRQRVCRGAMAGGDDVLLALARRARAARRPNAGGICSGKLGEVLISRRLLEEAETVLEEATDDSPRSRACHGFDLRGDAARTSRTGP